MKLARNIRDSLRRHIVFVLLFPLLLCIMSWPTVARVFDRDGFWLVQDSVDWHMLFWDAWYFERWITGQADFYYTDLLFHPTGATLAFHNFSLPHMALMASLKTVLPAPNAFNLTYLILTLVNGAAGYVYLNYLFRDRWVAVFGAVVFGLNAFIVDRPAHANIAFIATIPLSLYCLHRGLAEGRARLMLAAGFFIGATAFIGMYSLVCLLITLPCFVLYFARAKWRDRRFWLGVAAMLALAGGFLLLRFYPMLADPEGIAYAITKKRSIEAGADLLGYFVNHHHPLLFPLLDGRFPLNLPPPHWRNVVYLGWIPILLAGLAVLRGARWRWLPWALLALFFFTLRLGTALTVNGQRYDDIVLPLSQLREWLPHLFKPFWAVDNFQAGALLPFAALACFGLVALLRSASAGRRRAIILLLSCLLAFEYYIQPMPYELPAGRLDFIEWLQSEADQESIRLINLPFGGGDSKVYAFYQTYNGYPHAEGRPTRAPQRVFDYLEANLLLRNWRRGGPFNCLPWNRDAFIDAQEQLLADGFTHVALHPHRLRGETVDIFFVNIPAAYQDEQASVYRVEDLAASCDAPAFISPNVARRLRDLPLGLAFPAGKRALLSIRPTLDRPGAAQRPYTAVTYSLGGFELLRQSEIEQADAEWTREALAGGEAIYLLYDPLVTDAATVDAYRAWLLERYDSCGRLADAEDAVIEFMLASGYPCALAWTEAPYSLRYGGGLELGNLLIKREGERLTLFSLWHGLPRDAHSMSWQLFDADGEKALGLDFVFHHEALNANQLDLRSLAPGDYSLMLIVYDYATGKSRPGQVVSTGQTFQRELEVARLRID